MSRAARPARAGKAARNGLPPKGPFSGIPTSGYSRFSTGRPDANFPSSSIPGASPISMSRPALAGSCATAALTRRWGRPKPKPAMENPERNASRSSVRAGRSTRRSHGAIWRTVPHVSARHGRRTGTARHRRQELRIPPSDRIAASRIDSAADRHGVVALTRASGRRVKGA
jgi:hypothetical protein